MRTFVSYEKFNNNIFGPNFFDSSVPGFTHLLSKLKALQVYLTTCFGEKKYTCISEGGVFPYEMHFWSSIPRIFYACGNKHLKIWAEKGVACAFMRWAGANKHLILAPGVRQSSRGLCVWSKCKELTDFFIPFLCLSHPPLIVALSPIASLQKCNMLTS